jgi:secretion/DNA translocation related TadE-like protein
MKSRSTMSGISPPTSGNRPTEGHTANPNRRGARCATNPHGHHAPRDRNETDRSEADRSEADRDDTDRDDTDRDDTDRDDTDRDDTDRSEADRDDTDRGSATIWTVAAIAALLLFAAGILAVGTATVTRHRAAGAADLAALAAADYAPDGEQAACGWARWVADRMRVQLISCQLDGWDALVRTGADPPGPLARFGAATAQARAGPADG